MKKVMKISLIAMVSMLLLTGCGCKKKEKEEEKKEEIKVNTNEDVVKDQTVDIFSFTNTSLVFVNGQSELETTVENTSKKDAILKEFLIHVYDNDNKEIVTLTGSFGGEIKAGEKKVVNSYYASDLTKAKKITYELVK